MGHGSGKVKIQSVCCLGTVPAPGGTGWKIYGQDGGQSIPLGEQRLFVFSDTLLRLETGKAAFLGNCAGTSGAAGLGESLQEIRYFCDEAGMPRELIRATAGERMAGYRFWPQHGVPFGGRVYLFYLGIHQFDRKSMWGFRPEGTGLAIVDAEAGVAERVLTGNGEWNHWPSGDNTLHYGVQVVREGDTVYVFSSRRAGPYYTALLTRVDVSRMAEPSAHEPLRTTAPEWGGELATACDLGPCGGEFSVAYNAYLGCYLMVYVDSYSCRLYLRSAEHIWGPYGEPKDLGALPTREGIEMISLGFEHPYFAMEDGRVIQISYCQPNFTQNSLVTVRFA